MFIETPRFPDDIAYGAQGTIMYNTSITRSKSGRVAANANWAYPLHEYNVGYPVRTFNQLVTLTDYFHVCGGQFGGFRFKDHKDYKSCAPLSVPSHNDQVLGTGDGVTVTFKLIKYYTIGANSRARIIQKPVTGTVLIGVDGILQGSGYTVNYVTGVVTFDVAPTVGKVLTWGGEFDVPVKFKNDSLSSDIEGFKLSGLNVEVEEIRL